MVDNAELPKARDMVVTLVKVLSIHDGEMTVRELEDQVAKMLDLDEHQLSARHDKSRSEFQYRFAWTRTYAKKDGLVTSPSKGKWSLA